MKYPFLELFMRQEVLTWSDIDKLINHLIPQFDVKFDAMIMITRGGIIPGGLIAEAINIEEILTASIDFPAESKSNSQTKSHKFLAWPKFIQFPQASLLSNKNILIIDDVWGSGRTISSVKNMVKGAEGYPYTCVLHFNPHRNLFNRDRPDYYAAITDAYIIYPWEINRGQERVLPFDCR
jgi:hypoxanthine phosphoribosyltransferase